MAITCRKPIRSSASAGYHKDDPYSFNVIHAFDSATSLSRTASNTIIEKTERGNSKENSGADERNSSQETVRLQALLTHRYEQIRILKEKLAEQEKQIRSLRHSIEKIKTITLSVSSNDEEESNQQIIKILLNSRDLLQKHQFPVLHFASLRMMVILA